MLCDILDRYPESAMGVISANADVRPSESTLQSLAFEAPAEKVSHELNLAAMKSTAKRKKNHADDNDENNASATTNVRVVAARNDDSNNIKMTEAANRPRPCEHCKVIFLDKNTPNCEEEEVNGELRLK